MWEFFRGWRRKAGCVTLVMACAIAAIWVKSFTSKGTLELPKKVSGLHALFVESSHGTLSYVRRTREKHELFTNPWPEIDRFLFDFDPDTVKWDWKHLDFGKGKRRFLMSFGRGFVITAEETLWIIPYWSIVLPLTAISAWMLNTRPLPRKTNPKPTKPTATIGA
jgi:hypothetical protein